MSSPIVLFTTDDGQSVEVKEAPDETWFTTELLGRIIAGLYSHSAIENRVVTIKATNGVFRYELLDTDIARLMVHARKL